MDKTRQRTQTCLSNPCYHISSIVSYYKMYSSKEMLNSVIVSSKHLLLFAVVCAMMEMEQLKQKFRTEWDSEDVSKDRIVQIPTDETNVYCEYCNTTIRTKTFHIEDHAKNLRHQRGYAMPRRLLFASPLEINPVRALLKDICQ
ncbi:unnamed protein product [Lepeophtheirus salmonis]|uniref:(salmon louse) hypothetical protein n=1 Tax=Lepeophtheirus salmonis TaxID=72036 RepID=A0A817FAQ3_LEPSM|nr:unnamed protein product [Lepeophtheirus salmonis]